MSVPLITPQRLKLQSEIDAIDWEKRITYRDTYTGKEVTREQYLDDDSPIETARFFNVSGISDTLCTGYACEMKSMYGERCKIFGFHYEDNPLSHIAQVYGGHDFAVIDNRYLVDVWVTEIGVLLREGERQQNIFDLCSACDASIIAHLYGQRSTWTRLTDDVTKLGHEIYRTSSYLTDKGVIDP